MKYSMATAVHEAAHAVIAVKLGGFAEAIVMKPGQCHVSWPEDGEDWTRQRLLTSAAGPAATAVYMRRGQTFALFAAGASDYRDMKALGDTSNELFKEARKLCRLHWRTILAVAQVAQQAGTLVEWEINEIMRGAE